MEASPQRGLGSDRTVGVSLLCDDQPKDTAAPEMGRRSKADCFLDILLSVAVCFCVRKKREPPASKIHMTKARQATILFKRRKELQGAIG
ncbi:hypothetical protein A7K93_11165 [Candidatus Methylacidiphilum fumarolicum]|uniref:Uncharacterized protein n=2 Tax=Candidatus Methylacidiphilum fumarolicum TaxID=591154 RepID=I0JY22_METFB|nr:hypothetical protein A7K73_08095 [Candidatus Methylacidiphilum fumarolicum]CCG92141.1 hypothetical protein MFUM_370003 [Methylacidiphilum fumariolicum SolV]TFE71219.1 hypothetical protein A7K93_11165 [Candidatus Methylacidiphilum fumarolicum]TFE72012.1 hypothetical protein A7K72_09540 [Candidatus Methylacidiphilum fumarolicum]TFE77373.1 hypothetical protein A7D33_05185 [Candidatus Methylacidiphilum fumarolicum]